MAARKLKTKIVDVGEEDEERKTSILTILNKAFKKKYGAASVVNGNTFSEDTSTLSTGSPLLDIALRFPLPVGIHEIAGGESAGKSTLCVHACSNAQKKGWPVYYIDLERGLNPSFLARFKDLELESFNVLHPETSEDAMDMAIQIFKQIDCAVVIYDSIPASLATQAIMAKSMSDQTMGVVAKLMSTFLAKCTPIVHNSRGRLILINQLRENLSIYGGRPTMGGNPVEHYTTQRIFLKGAKTKSNLIKDANGTIIGKRINAVVEKNRWSIPGTETNIHIKFDIGIWPEYEIINLACSLGIINVRGSWYTFPDDTKVQGEGGCIAEVAANPNKLHDLKIAINELVGM